MDSVLIQANAKINLDLKIIRKLPSGYHQIESLMQSIDLSDFLLFRKAKKDQITGAIICPEIENIILKAKKTLEKNIGRKLFCQIHLQKSIPIAAGLGGGSADAAATLLGLNLLYNLNLSKKELAKIGIQIGADVPFFFYGGTCKAEGVGEEITQAKKRVPNFFVLFRPHKRLETKMMYELYDKNKKDFFTLSKELCPDIVKIENYLNKFKLKIKLSGSGPTVFCGVNNYEIAKKITEDYQDFNGDTFICRPVTKSLNVIK